MYPRNDEGIPVVAENALRWPLMGGTYLEVVGCLGAALVDLSGRVTDFKIVDGFLSGFRDRLTLVQVNMNGSGKGGIVFWTPFV